MTDDGRPYLVMEYVVTGRRIDESCDDRRLDVPTRLGLFVQVCVAVHLAHQHAVIHRDLKPSHILVASDGVPKLLEFGIAELIHPDRGSSPEYASPEQIEGGPITTASDVYALGVVLYQLLTGHGPYRLEDGTTSEILQAICEQVPERPSLAVARRPLPRADSAPPMPSAPTPEAIAEARGVSHARLARLLAGDLDAIVLMALRKEPESRYASAEQFADDVRRHLKGLPVRGAPRLGRVIDARRSSVRRHRGMRSPRGSSCS